MCSDSEEDQLLQEEDAEVNQDLEDDQVDPLDAFMNDLQENNDIAKQVTTSKEVEKSEKKMEENEDGFDNDFGDEAQEGDEMKIERDQSDEILSNEEDDHEVKKR